MELREYQSDMVQNLRKAYQQGYKSPCLVLGCGGGKSVIAADIAKKSAIKGNRILVLVHRIELCEQLRETFEWWGCDMSMIDIYMVQTASRRLKALPEYNFIITDENHHCVANSYKRIYEHYQNAKLLGFTATPAHSIIGGLESVNDKLIIGVSVQWLIDNKYLAPYKYYSVSLADLSALGKKKGDYDQQQASELMDKPKIYGDVIAYYRKFADGMKSIVYAPTVDYSIKIAEQFRSAGINAEHLDGETPKELRKQIISDFRKGDIKILCNCNIVLEGFNVPDAECCILLRPTQSLILQTQSSMRCMRYMENKTSVIIDFVANYTRHGLPADPHEWDLKEKQRGQSKENTIIVRQCEKCYYTFRSPQTICPECGWINQKTREEIKQIKDAELQEIKEAQQLKIKNSKNPWSCKTLEELEELAKERGYDKGWAYIRAKIQKIR